MSEDVRTCTGSKPKGFPFRTGLIRRRTEGRSSGSKGSGRPKLVCGGGERGPKWKPQRAVIMAGTCVGRIVNGGWNAKVGQRYRKAPERRDVARRAAQEEGEEETGLSLDDILNLTEAADDAVATENVTPVAKWFKKNVFDEKYLRLHYGTSRSKWMGASTVPPSHLKGTVAGDYGFDPAGLSADPAQFQRMRESEIMHGRWAMLGVVGCLLPEAIRSGTRGPDGMVEAAWFKAISIDNSAGASDGSNLVDSFQKNPSLVALMVMLVLVSVSEALRTKEEGIERVYPGGQVFDPLGLAFDADCAKDLKVREIKNGRIAMVTMLGFFVQATVTGKGPVENLLSHLADPVRTNVITSTQALTS